MPELSDKVTTPALRVQRVVFEHGTGPWKGLKQIMGTTEEFEGEVPHATTDPFTAAPDGRKVLAGLVASKRTYLLYREINTPLAKTFDRRQR